MSPTRSFQICLEFWSLNHRGDQEGQATRNQPNARFLGHGPVKFGSLVQKYIDILWLDTLVSQNIDGFDFLMNKKGQGGLNLAHFRRPAAFAAMICQRKRRKIQGRADFTLYKFKDESHTLRLEILPSELPF